MGRYFNKVRLTDIPACMFEDFCPNTICNSYPHVTDTESRKGEEHSSKLHLHHITFLRASSVLGIMLKELYMCIISFDP